MIKILTPLLLLALCAPAAAQMGPQDRSTWTFVVCSKVNGEVKVSTCRPVDEPKQRHRKR